MADLREVRLVRANPSPFAVFLGMKYERTRLLICSLALLARAMCNHTSLATYWSYTPGGQKPQYQFESAYFPAPKSG